MYLLFILLLLLPTVIGKDSKDTTIKLPDNLQCSVFPGSEPKCFPPTKDLTNSPDKTVKEITIWSSRVINPHIDKTIDVGSNTYDNIGCKDDVFTCEKQVHGWYEKNYETDIEEKSRSRLSSENRNEMFITTRREVWLCRNEQKNDEPFYRIVNELLSTHAFGSVAFYNGIEVTRIPIPLLDDAKEGSKQTYTTVIREIKYIANDVVTKYEGFLKFKQGEQSCGQKACPDFSQLHTSESARLKQSSELKHEIKYSDHGLKTVVEITRGNRLSPKAFREKMQFEETTIGTVATTSKALCEEIKEAEPNFRLAEHLPRWYFSQKTKVVGPDEEITWTSSEETLVSPKDFLSYFVVTKHLVWKCKVKGGNNEVFYRTEIEYVGTVEIDTAEVYDGTTVFKFALTKDITSMGIRQIIYFKKDSPQKRLKFYGTVELRKPVLKQIVDGLKVLIPSCS